MKNNKVLIVIAAALLGLILLASCGGREETVQETKEPLLVITPAGDIDPTEYVPRTANIVTWPPTEVITEAPTPDPADETETAPTEKTKKPTETTPKPTVTATPYITPVPTATATPTPEQPTEAPPTPTEPKPTATQQEWDPSVYYREEDDLPYARYYIEVSLKAQIVYIFSTDEEGNKDSLVKTMICSSGRDGKTPERYWIVLDNDTQGNEITDTGFDSRYDFEWVKGCAVQYITRMWKAEWDDNGKLKVSSSSYLFHSTPFDSKDKNTLRAADWNKLGTPVSDGCIRLCVRDAHWIYTKVAPYSIVRTVQGEEDPETWNELKLPDIPEYITKDPTDVY